MAENTDSQTPDEPDILRVCADAAGVEGVEFVLIGGHAVSARGYDRTTLDVDFLVAGSDIAVWAQILERAGYRLISERVTAFAQYVPTGRTGLPVDLMLVDDGTFSKLLAGSDWLEYGGRHIRVAGVLHLIALKLHALGAPERGLAEKDLFDILGLARRHSIDIEGAEFREILDRYASEAIRQRLLRELKPL